MNIHPGHFAAIFGGACAGSEAAYQLARRGIYVAVFDQQTLPYGKIEDGLPKWHVKLRNKEEGKIDEKLSHPNIFFVPKTRLGWDIEFEDIVTRWGFSAVLLASGAWRDRPLPVEGIDGYIGKGFYYQNPFVDWFNHHHEPDYDRYPYHVEDNAIVVGGGLASIDVVKILMLETTVRALEEKKGIKTDILTLEHQGIPKTLESLGVSFSELGLKGCTLFYRRRNMDMPLGPMPPNPTPERIAKMQKVRQKILANAQRDYLFKFQECSKPVDKIVEDNRLAGLVFQKTKIADGRVVSLPGSEFEVRSPLVISSIGSIPEPIPGIPTKGELFIISDEDTGKMDNYENVFALGNAVTGRGNIRESELHARQVVQHVMDEYLNWREEDYEAASSNGWPNPEKAGNEKILNKEQITTIVDRLKTLQESVGYDGDYKKWAEKHRPVRLEEVLAQANA